jgi:hypothetical protein
MVHWLEATQPKICGAEVSKEPQRHKAALLGGGGGGIKGSDLKKQFMNGRIV